MAPTQSLFSSVFGGVSGVMSQAVRVVRQFSKEFVQVVVCTTQRAAGQSLRNVEAFYAAGTRYRFP